MAEAISYALNQWETLTVFCADGAVPIDNNVSEREMKRVVLNRKNSLFVGNPAADEPRLSLPASPAPADATTSTRSSTSPSCWSICQPTKSASCAWLPEQCKLLQAARETGRIHPYLDMGFT
jgi:hypothetical protein